MFSLMSIPMNGRHLPLMTSSGYCSGEEMYAGTDFLPRESDTVVIGSDGEPGLVP